MEFSSQIKLYKACNERRISSQNVKPSKYCSFIWDSLNWSKCFLYNSWVLLRSRSFLLLKETQKASLEVSKNGYKTSDQCNKIFAWTSIEGDSLWSKATKYHVS